MGFVEKMQQNWDTWEDIVKDSDPFLDDISARFATSDFDAAKLVLDELDDVKELVARLNDEFYKVFEEARPPLETVNAAVDEMFELYKMIEDRDKFYDLLKSDAVLNEFEKSLITRDWEILRAKRLKVDRCLGLETIEECLERKSVEVSEARPKAYLLEPRMEMMSKYILYADGIRLWMESFIDAFVWPSPPSPSPAITRVTGNIGSSSSPTNKRVKHNIGSSSSPTNKRVKHNIGGTTSASQ